MQKARAQGLTVSCDLNYRQKLWTWGKSAEEVMRQMIGSADILIANEEHLTKVLGTNPMEVQSLTEKLLTTYAGLKGAAITVRESNKWSACLNDRQEYCTSRAYDVGQSIDRIGSGDAFAAGLIYGWTHLPNRREALEFAAAASCLKHSIPGDFCRATVDEIHALVRGADGRIQR
jgi:2-dehydro-3-deoxygluconokinase